MKVVEQDFDSSPDWVGVIANAMGGVVDGNFIRGDNDIYKGTHLILNIEEEIIAMLVDVSFKQTLLLKHKNNTDTSFVVLSFFMYNSDVELVMNKKTTRFGKLDYNFLMIDGALDVDHIIEKETNLYCIYVIIKKTIFREYLKNVCKIKEDIVFDSKKNTIINVDRMSYQSQVLINDFRKMAPDNPYYEMSFKALTYALINNYLEQLKTKKTILGEVVNDDIKRIIVSKKFLQKNINEAFPGIDFLAAKALMSPTKYKLLFTKVLGSSPAVYFHDSKLKKAKELIETKQYTVGEVSDQLNYSSASYLARKFTNVYGVSPKEYQNLL
ncbi:AraC family transcriptional regulator [Flavobacterium sp. EDS]|uniref:helix-turn-helix transcriptional regulator n=1 Tax=Flavobacterium sp. EDS TaxID=2897328 RepID=UPI001E28ABA6|nr:AraC family transcriptional regulator [Flavobacterium sp. EDS]MCD0476331.1 AraC family transcriptional regulator [Flavobacterium sp. EDS]